MKKIAVVGSINMDLVIETNVIPEKGETVLGTDFFVTPGGKGANQAVSAAKLGGDVTLFGSLGDDQYGAQLRENFNKTNVNIGYLQTIPNEPTGIAAIQISDDDNRIIVIPGANQFTDKNYIRSMVDILTTFDIIVLQLEIPVEGIAFLIEKLSPFHKQIILDPAPATRINQEILDKVTYLIPNEHEFSVVLNSEYKMEEALKKYPNKLLITRGEKGVSYYDGREVVTVPSLKVNVVDTTGAGDTFAGAFAVALAKNEPLVNAIQYANIAAGISTTKFGAQTGMPTLSEMKAKMDLI